MREDGSGPDGVGGESGSGTLVLVATDTQPEREAVDDWLAANGPEPAAVVHIDDERLAAALETGDDDLLVRPIRVAWLPAAGPGGPVARLSRLVSYGSSHPGPTAQRRIMVHDPGRCRVITGEPATLGELRGRARARDTSGRFVDFVRRQADLALGHAERAVLGSQYKVARHVVAEITTGPRFRAGVEALAERTELPVEEVEERARAALTQMVATQSRRAIDAWNQLGRYFSRAYQVIVDESRTEELRQLARRHPLVFLPSHRSYLDPIVLRPALLAQGLPLNHVLGGLNVDFWPVGALTRRSGYVFIRRSFGDDGVYRWALREYMGYLLGKRFNLEWYIEGGRSRTGKLRPPRFGLLTYLVEAFRESSASDVYLVPVSLTYDQLYEVGVMAEEAHGGAKQAESLAWLLRYNRAQNRVRGSVQVRFGEPLSLAAALADEPDTRLAVQKTAFEVCHRINRASPVLPGSLVTLTLLGIEDRALTVGEVKALLDPLVDYVERLGVARREQLALDRERDVRRALAALVASGVVERYDKGTEPVYRIGPDQHLVAAFYRNNAIHFLVNRAIAELVLQTAAEERFEDPAEDVWRAALELRDLLKFEFFFSDKERYRTELERELTLLDPEWRTRLASDRHPDGAGALLASARPLLAHRVLAPFLEAYQVVADRLANRDPRQPVESKAFFRECLDVARQLRMRQRLTSTESISAELFGTALRLAANRDLVDPGREELAAGRRVFATEIALWVGRLRRIRDLALHDPALDESPRP